MQGKIIVNLQLVTTNEEHFTREDYFSVLTYPLCIFH